MSNSLDLQQLIHAWEYQTAPTTSTWGACERAEHPEAINHRARGSRVCRRCLEEDLTAGGFADVLPLLEAQLAAHCELVGRLAIDGETDDGDACLDLKFKLTAARAAVYEWIEQNT